MNHDPSKGEGGKLLTSASILAYWRGESNNLRVKPERPNP